MVAEIEATILGLVARGGLSVLLVEQHVGFAPRAAERYYVLESGSGSSTKIAGAARYLLVRHRFSGQNRRSWRRERRLLHEG